MKLNATAFAVMNGANTVLDLIEVVRAAATFVYQSDHSAKCGSRDSLGCTCGYDYVKSTLFRFVEVQ